ncbi:MAG: DUF427 domain-containing protein [Acidimicrobiales bacterium]|nr:DUF427 domain-containing protein [Acidimicrobiales bacterium]MDP6901474.1 DUF427 domain-containing protein [Acidimicrobiales bacterium]
MESHIKVQKVDGHVTVSVGERTVAHSSSVRLLLEGNLPPRHYFPRNDVDMELLIPSESVTHCPHKGDARYWSIEVDDRHLEDAVWSYETPIESMSAISGLLCFYDERVQLNIED